MRGPDTRWLGLGETPPDLARPAVWLLCDDDPEAVALAEAVRVGAEDLADAALFRTDVRAAARLRRRRLLRALAGRCLGCAPEAVRIGRSPQGALSIAAPRPLSVSHSSSAGRTLIGLCEQPIGVDLEPDDPHEPLPLDGLHPKEAAVVTALPPADRPSAFARFWTVKEAALKAMGRGLLVDPASVEARFSTDIAEVRCQDRLVAAAESRRIDRLLAAVAVLV